MSLLELMVVASLLGGFAAVAAARFGRSAEANFGSQADARRLALDLLQCQRGAIATGDNHYVSFQQAGGFVTGYTVWRDAAGGPVAADLPRTIAAGEAVTTNQGQVEFGFDGAALSAAQVTFSGPNQTWRLDVVPATGAVQMQRIP